MKNPFILLIEDNENDLVMIADTFEQAGLSARLMEMRDSIAALAYFQKLDVLRTEIPDLVILDINMPKKNGFEVLREIRQLERFNHLPIVMLTTSNSEKDHRRALELGAVSVLVKPLQFEKFEMILKQFNLNSGAGK